MNQFQEHSYLIVPNFIKVNGLYKHLMKFVEKNNCQGDSQAMNSPSFYGETKCKILHQKALKLMEKHTGLKLFKTYTYCRIYKKDVILTPHTDRPACEISATVCIGFEGYQWELYINNKDELPIRILLNPCDALLYKGCEKTHWRPRLEGNNHVQVFLHYVNKNGSNAWCKNDLQKQKI